MTVTPARRTRRHVRAVAALCGVVLLASACGSDDGDDAASAAPPAEAEASSARTLAGTVNLGFFPNVTHAPALVGMEQGLFADALGDGVELNPFTFNAGTEAIEALFAGAIDLTFIGPNPAINAFAQSNGEAIRIVSGTTSGGAYFVVKPEITAPDQLAGSHDRNAVPGQHPGRRPTGLAGRPGSRDHARGWWRRDDPSAVERDDRSSRSSLARSTARGCPSRGPRG